MLNFIEEPITVYTLSTKEKQHHQSKITQQIISIITDLTKKNNVYHKIYYVDKQSPELIFLKIPVPKSFLPSTSIIYISC